MLLDLKQDIQFHVKNKDITDYDQIRYQEIVKNFYLLDWSSSIYETRYEEFGSEHGEWF